MKQAEARQAIIQIWDSLGFHSAKAGATEFVLYLQRHCTEVLDFRTPGSEPYEAVKSWLISAGRLEP